MVHSFTQSQYLQKAHPRSPARQGIGPMACGPARGTWLAWPLMMLTLMAAGCVSAPAPKERIAVLKVQAEPKEARVYVNGRFAGRASVLQRVGKALQPGVQYVTFVSPGYFPHDERIELSAGETTVKMKLRPVPQ